MASGVKPTAGQTIMRSLVQRMNKTSFDIPTFLEGFGPLSPM
jgi:hypothetical protein